MEYIGAQRSATPTETSDGAVQTLTKKEALKPQAPLVGFFRHPIKWVWIKIQLLGWSVTFSFIGLLIVAGVYYFCFETTDTMNNLWHHVPTGPRHDIRDYGEGLFGGLLGQLIVWNHQHAIKATFKKVNFLDKFEMNVLGLANLKDDIALKLSQFAKSVPAVLAYALPGFLFLAPFVIFLVHHFNGDLSTGGNWAYAHTFGHLPSQTRGTWSLIGNTLTDNWQKKVPAYGAAFFWGRRPAKPMFDDIQLWVCEWMFKNGKVMHHALPPTWQARYNTVTTEGIESEQAHPAWMSRVFIGLTVLSAFFLGWGCYAIFFKA